ncbi:MAG TPA: NAD-binding protein [Burkholderiaceae bacterium]|nr:NAD-binding protein [Burkholderiaceae bacterium]
MTFLGAGLIGCEFADDLVGSGHAVTLVDPNPLPPVGIGRPCALARAACGAGQAYASNYWGLGTRGSITNISDNSGD